jgi:hypothetical protein
MLFFLHLRDVWRRPSWPTEPRTTLRASPRLDPARVTFVGLLPDLPGDTGLTGTTWRRCKELLRVLVGSKRCQHNNTTIGLATKFWEMPSSNHLLRI